MSYLGNSALPRATIQTVVSQSFHGETNGSLYIQIPDKPNSAACYLIASQIVKPIIYSDSVQLKLHLGL